MLGRVCVHGGKEGVLSKVITHTVKEQAEEARTSRASLLDPNVDVKSLRSNTPRPDN